MGYYKTPINAPPLSLEEHNQRKRPHLYVRPEEENDEGLSLPRRKRVRFATTPSGDLQTSEQEPDTQHKALDKAKLWWSRRDRESFTHNCQKAIVHFRQDYEDEIDHYLDVFDRCTENPSAASSEYLEQAQLKLPAHIRGLEWGLAPSTKIHRYRHVHEVLDVQDQVQGLSATMRDRLLSSRSLRSSRPCRLMARLLGDVDASESSS